MRVSGATKPVVRQNGWIKHRRNFRHISYASCFKYIEIALGRLRPCHRSARGISAFAHGMASDIVRQQRGNFISDRSGIVEWNQNAAAISQKFFGVPIRRRYNCLSQAEAVGKRARRHLRFVEIGRNVDIAHRNEIK